MGKRAGAGNNRAKGRAPPRRKRQPKRSDVALVAPPALATHMALPSIAMDHHKFVRGVTPVVLAKSATDYANVFTFALSDVQGYTDFTSLFDMYKLMSVQFTIRAEQVPANNAPLIIYALADYDGGATPDLDTIQQRRHVEVVLTPDRPSFTFTLKPRLAMSVGNTGGTAVASGISSPWLDVASPSVPFYGIAMVIKNYLTANTAASVYRSAQYSLAFRSPR